jgi:hypothetical protein
VRTAPRVVAVALLLVSFVVAPRAHGQLITLIEDPRFEPGAQFGHSVAMFGSDVVVGVPGSRVFDVEGAGIVQRFDVTGTLRVTFEALTPVAGAALGTMVVSSGDRLYASAPGDQPIGVSGRGAIYVFDAVSGVLLQVIGAPDPDASTAPVGGTLPGTPILGDSGPLPVPLGFGRGLAVADNRIVVGAPDSIVDDVAGAGAVFVFDTNGALVRTLRDFTARPNAFFGAWVAVIGDLIVVGVPGERSGGVDRAGEVRIFDATTGDLLQILSPPISTFEAEYGAVVGEIGGGLFVSAPRDRTPSADGPGAVYLYSLAPTRLRQIITPPTVGPASDFGRAVIAAGDRLVVGAPGVERDALGTAFLIEPVTGDVITIFEPIVRRAGGRFGSAVAAASDLLIAIGEPGRSDSSLIGRVYLFGPSSPVPTPAPGPGTSGGPGDVERPAAAARCPQGATTRSIDCRLAALVASVQDTGLPRLAGSLRRAGREVRRAESARGSRRIRALRRAARAVGVFAARVQSPRVPAAVRAAFVTESSTLSGDLASLVGGTR